MSSSAEGDCATDHRPSSGCPREVWVLIASNAVIALGYGVVSPVLPQYARNFGVSISAATFVITAFAVMRLCFAPATGLLIQRLGERRVYVSGILIVAVTTGACAFAQTYWQLLLFRSLGGIGSTMFFVSALGLMIRISPDGRPRPGGGHVLDVVSARVGRWAGAGRGHGGIRAGRAVHHLRRRVDDRGSRGVLQSAELVAGGAGGADRADGDGAGGVAPAGLSRRAVVELRDGLGGVRAADRAGAAVRRRRRSTRARYRRAGAGDVRGRQRVGGFPSGYLSDRVGRRKLLIIGLSVSAVATALVGFSTSLPVFLAGAYVAGAASGIFSSPQQAAVADIIGSKARAGTAVATFQMMADLGSIIGSLVVGQVAQHTSFGWAFVVSGGVLLVAAVGWTFAPETRGRPPAEHTPARALGPEAGGEVP